MSHHKLLCLIGVICTLAGTMTAQQKVSAPEQSPRQAAIEMFSGGEDAFKKHLTLEVQAKLNELLKNSATGDFIPAQTLSLGKVAAGQNLENFDAGPILFSYNNAEQHERFEIHIEGDDLHGEQDDMELSMHVFHAGVEQDLPVVFHLLLSWKVQEGIWRLNEVVLRAQLLVGDPRILNQAWWNASGMHSLGDTAAAESASPAPGNQDDHSPMTAARAVRLIGLAENIYAQKHPESGFTCNIADLVNVGKGLDNGQTYRFMEAEFATGVVNGYRFSLSGCAGKPAKAFRVMAEPLSGAGRAYCSDPTRNLRASDDGSGANCVASGKIVQR